MYDCLGRIVDLVREERRGEESYVQEEGKKMEGWRGADSTVERKIGRSASVEESFGLSGEV